MVFSSLNVASLFVLCYSTSIGFTVQDPELSRDYQASLRAIRVARNKIGSENLQALKRRVGEAIPTVDTLISEGEFSAATESIRLDTTLRGRLELLPCLETEAIDCLRRIAMELPKYPEGLLKRHVGRLLLCKSVRVDGIAAAGANYGNTVIVDCTRRYESAATFHHEVLSAILDKVAFPRTEWRNVNPKGFEYLRGNGRIATPSLLDRLRKNWQQDDGVSKAFVNWYAAVSLENDICETGSRLLESPAEFYHAFSQSGPLLEKEKLLAEFFVRIDSRFTIDRVRQFDEATIRREYLEKPHRKTLPRNGKASKGKSAVG